MQTITDLNNQHAIPNHVQFALGAGSLPMMFVNNQHATATISLLGGQVLTYQQHGAQPILWVSPQADYAVGKAIRGGVPLIFPWFGAHPRVEKLPSHGLLRTRLWQVASTTILDDGATQLVLTFKDNPDTRALWPYTFHAEATITVGETLTISLTVTNTGVRAFAWSGALHTYFSVGKLADVTVKGLDGVAYQDKVHGDERVQTGDIVFKEETDRVYLTDVASTPIVDANWERTINAIHSGHDSVIVWNPSWTAVKHDLPRGVYHNFVCVETGAGARVAAMASTLTPKQSHTVGVVISAE